MDGWIWIAVYAGLFFVMMRYGCGAHMMGHNHSRHENGEDQEGPEKRQPRGKQHKTRLTGPTSGGNGTFVDPVCGMPVPRDEGYGKMYQSIPYRFCSRECLDKFDEDADRYVHGGTGKAA